MFKLLSLRYEKSLLAGGELLDLEVQLKLVKEINPPFRTLPMEIPCD